MNCIEESTSDVAGTLWPPISDSVPGELPLSPLKWNCPRFHLQGNRTIMVPWGSI